MSALLAVAVAQALDLVTLLLALQRVPWGESNPLAVGILAGDGLAGIVAFKAAGVLAALIVLAALARLRPRLANVGALLAIGLGAFGALTNIVGGGLL